MLWQLPCLESKQLDKDDRNTEPKSLNKQIKTFLVCLSLRLVFLDDFMCSHLLVHFVNL